jgi:vacuolar-type H+-ATPase subunit C/Vma6
LAGTLPTPALPERALRELARQPAPRGIAVLLVAWRHPYGPALLAAASPGETDLLRLELALNRSFAERLTRLAGAGPLAAFVRETLDVENACAALVLAGQPQDVVPRDAFVRGGARVGIRDFEEAVSAGSVEAAARRLARAFGSSPLASAFARAGSDPASIEESVLRLRLAAVRREARRHPLGPAPLLAFALALQAQVMDLRRIIWSRALSAPRAAGAGALVTV